MKLKISKIASPFGMYFSRSFIITKRPSIDAKSKANSLTILNSDLDSIFSIADYFDNY